MDRGYGNFMLGTYSIHSGIDKVFHSNLIAPFLSVQQIWIGAVKLNEQSEFTVYEGPVVEIDKNIQSI